MTIKTTTPSSNGIKVLLIYTGGTIGMLENPITKGLEVCDFAYVAEHVQEISQLPFCLLYTSIGELIPSSLMITVTLAVPPRCSGP